MTACALEKAVKRESSLTGNMEKLVPIWSTFYKPCHVVGSGAKGWSRKAIPGQEVKPKVNDEFRIMKTNVFPKTTLLTPSIRKPLSGFL